MNADYLVDFCTSVEHKPNSLDFRFANGNFYPVFSFCNIEEKNSHIEQGDIPAVWIEIGSKILLNY